VEIPKAIGPFELRRTIGHGMYGDVYEAFDPDREIRAAVKLFAKAPRGAAAFGRLRRDAQAAGALGHPNIATVIGVGEHEGVPWVATELVTGVSLAQVVRSHAFWPIERVLDVWRQLCEGLAHAHREGLLHLDLKPSDVRVNADGDVKVVDFGIWHVKTLERRRPRTSDEGLHYRPPEVVEGRRPDLRADIFAVGAIVYELVTRRKAFPGESPTEVVRSVSRCEPDLASLPSSAFSPGFEHVLAACLDRDPEARPASFEDVHADLVQLVRDTAPRLREPAVPPLDPAPEREGFLEDLTKARAEDRLEDALDACRKLLALDPEDESARRSLSDVESVMLGREADELVGRALAHAADGELDLATRLAEKVERLAPWSPRYLELQVYLDEEGARRAADHLVATARESQAEGRAREARAALEGALAAMPGHAAATRLLEDLKGEPAPPDALTPGSDEPLPSPDRSPPAVGSPEDAPPTKPPSTSPRAEAEALTADALRLFTANEHERARDAVARALDLDPTNRRARELHRILRVLG
jgi:serine/threonine protein kinase